MNRESFLHFGIVTLGMLLTAVAFVWWHYEVSSASEEAATLAAEVTARGDEYSRTARARSELAALAADESFVEGRFLPVAEIVPFLEGLERSGEEFGATVSVASVSDALAGERIAVALKIQGSFDEVMRTLGTIEYGSYASSVSALTLDTPDGEVWSAALTLVIGARETETP